jgi:hypothetical protein
LCRRLARCKASITSRPCRRPLAFDVCNPGQHSTCTIHIQFKTWAAPCMMLLYATQLCTYACSGCTWSEQALTPRRGARWRRSGPEQRLYISCQKFLPDSGQHRPLRKEQGAHIQQATGHCKERDQWRSRNRRLCAYTTAMHGKPQHRRESGSRRNAIRAR